MIFLSLPDKQVAEVDNLYFAWTRFYSPDRYHGPRHLSLVLLSLTAACPQSADNLGCETDFVIIVSAVRDGMRALLMK